MQRISPNAMNAFTSEFCVNAMAKEGRFGINAKLANEGSRDMLQ